MQRIGSRILSLDDGALATRLGRGVRVGVVDSGIANGHPHVGDVLAGIRIAEDGSDDDDAADRIGHGTAVAAAIREKAPEAELLPVRVFDRHLSTTADVLARAIRAAADRDCRLINLSLGTANAARRSLLQAAVDYASARGALVISPGAQDDARWLPGCLDGVIAAHVDWTCPRDGIRISMGADGVRLEASGFPRPIPGVQAQRNLHGISFATANITGLLARWLEERPDVRRAEDVLRSLQNDPV